MKPQLTPDPNPEETRPEDQSQSPSEDLKTARSEPEATVSSNPAAPFDRVPEVLRPALERRGFTTLTTVQTATLEVGTACCDLQISSQTGSGKTVALGFVMTPALIDSVRDWNPRERRGPGAVIIVPTRELAAQVHAELEWLFADVTGVAVDSVTGGTNIAQERRRLARSPRILVGTPGRLLDHIRNKVVDCSGVFQLVLDEADQMLDMGFREELEAILAGMPEERRTHLVSATFPPAVHKLTERYQTAPIQVEGTTPGAAHADIEHVAHLIHASDRYATLTNLLLLADGERTLVFVPTRIEAAQVSERLSGDGFAALPLSGDLQQAQRTRTLAAFKAGSITTLVATDVAARGLDVPDVSLVIHSDTPQDASAYTHRSGRTGRAGNKGHSVLLVPLRAERRVKRVAADAGIELQWHEVPTASRVKKRLAKRARRRIQARLAKSGTPTQSQLNYARTLLENREPEEVIAALAAMIQPELPVEPAEISAPTSKGASRSDGKLDSRPERFHRGHDYERFSINWGDRRGANPKRLLALVCRRGGISSRMVGAIIVGPFASSVEIAYDAARAFEVAVRKPDSRDPELRIRPAGRASGPPRSRSARSRG